MSSVNISHLQSETEPYNNSAITRGKPKMTRSMTSVIIYQLQNENIVVENNGVIMISMLRLEPLIVSTLVNL